MKKILSLVLALSLILASCGYIASVEAEEKRVLHVAFAAIGRGDENPAEGNEHYDDNYATQYIIDNWATPNNIELHFDIIDDTGDSSLQNYTLMLASETAPDLYYMTVGEGSSWVRKQAADNMLYDLTEELEKYGSHIVDYLGKDFIERNGVINGKLYAIPGKECIPAISHTWIRQDWLDILGLDVPTDFDAWYNCLVSFKENADKLAAAGAVKDAENVIPYGMYHTRYFTDWERIVTRFYNPKIFDKSNVEYYRSGYGIEYNKEGFKEGMSFMNHMYNDGLMSKNFALDVDKEYFERDIVQGNFGCYTDNLFSGWGPSDPESWQSLSRTNVGAVWTAISPFTNLYDNVARNPLDPEVLTYAVVPWFSENADLAIQYLDFVWTPENNIAINYGIEDVSYRMTDIGAVLYSLEEMNKNGFYHMVNSSEARRLTMIGRTVNDIWSRTARSGATNVEEAEYAEKIHKMIEENGYDRFPAELDGIPEVAQYMGGLRDTWSELLTNLIMASDDTAFEKIYSEGVAELESLGSRTILDAIDAAFASNWTK